jgi:hypothetical protein
VSQLTSELQRMADDAARQARPLAAAEIIRQGDRHRRRSLTRQSLGGLSAAGVVGAGVALGLGLTSSAPAVASGTSRGTITTAAFTLVSNANGTATLTINPNVLLEPSVLQRDLKQHGIPAIVTEGSFCSSSPAPEPVMQVVELPKIPRPKLSPPLTKAGPLPPPTKPGSLPQWTKAGSSPPPKPGNLPQRTMTINPAAIPAGTELSFGNFQSANGVETLYTLIDTGSYTCTSTAPTTPPPDGGEINYTNPS